MIQQRGSLFGTDDTIIVVSILILSITAFRLPETQAFSTEYPTALYYTFTSVAQALGPFLILLSLLIFSIKQKRGNFNTRPVRGLVVSTITFVLSLVGLPFARDLSMIEGVGQGAAVCIVLLTIWGVGLAILLIVEEVFSSD
ncbi:MAG: hypothetical protein J4G05_08730 [Chlorobi bacterium]|nr:hypothetical protein [Chlorobiota bacterium]